eukprot:m.290010 g.290010  ORF g.290010 m.290010 type:complete len:1604 (-) comp12228_c0_seq1:130-4941(-)
MGVGEGTGSSKKSAAARASQARAKSAMAPVATVGGIEGLPAVEGQAAMDSEGLFSDARAQRSKWKSYLAEAAKLAAEPPSSDLNAGDLARILQGDCTLKLREDRTIVRLFTSSTFTDTKDERDLLMDDVYPYLKRLCAELDMQFQVVDMRWGVREQTMDDHGTSKLCLSEVDRCLQESAGPCFVTMLGDKYGFRPFPAEVDANEFDTLIAKLRATVGAEGAPHSADDIDLLLQWFRRDDNAVPARYVLSPISTHLPDFLSSDKESQRAASTEWWKLFERMQHALRYAATSALSPEAAEKYIMSVTEDEVRAGVVKNPECSNRVFVFRRSLKGLEHITNMDEIKRFVDITDNTRDEQARDRLQALKDSVIESRFDDSEEQWHILDSDIEYPSSDIAQQAYDDYLRDFADEFCERMVRSILSQYSKHRVCYDAHLQDVLQHRSFVISRGHEFVGRTALVGSINAYVSSPSTKPLTVWGLSGSGKTSLMCKTALELATKPSVPGAVVISRFCGTTPDSSGVFSLVRSLCIQLERVYKGGNSEGADLPGDFKQLTEVFHKRLAYATSEQPLVLLLDSLDQLDDSDRGRNLKWLPSDLPAHCKLIVSTLPVEGGCLKALCFRADKELPAYESDASATAAVDLGPDFVQVTSLSADDGKDILHSWLHDIGRKVSPSQESILLSHFRNTPYPLYLRLLFDMARLWASFTEVDGEDIADSVRGVINQLFSRLERKHGKLLVQNAFGYLTCSVQGLTITELDDLLSMNDAVLDDVYQWWTPPMRRLPPLLWNRLRNDLGGYIVERGVDGARVYSWYHRQFWEVARERYLEAEGVDQLAVHKSMAQYFGDEIVFPERRITHQPLRTQGGLINRRKLTELPHHQVKAKLWPELRTSLLDVNFLEAAVEDGRVFAVLRLMNTAVEMLTKEAPSSEELVILKEYCTAVNSEASRLIKERHLLFQSLANQFEGSHPSQDALALAPQRKASWLKLLYRPRLREETCPVSFTGHTNWGMAATIHPKFDLIATGSLDKTCRIWQSSTGEELLSIERPYTILACRFSDSGEYLCFGGSSPECEIWRVSKDTLPAKMVALNTKHDQVRALAFSKDSKLLATSGGDGAVRVWTVGADPQLLWTAEHGSSAKGVAFSFDGKLVASAGWDGMLKLWDAADGKFKSQMTIKSSSMDQYDVKQGAAFSPDGQFVGATCDNEMAVFAVSSGERVFHSVCQGGRGFCCEFTPNSKFFCAGVEAHRVVVYDVSTWKEFRALTGHPGSVRDIHFAANGSGEADLVSIDAGRGIKIWHGEMVQTLPQDLPWHSGAINNMHLSSDGQFVAVNGGEAKLWSLDDGTCVGPLTDFDTYWSDDQASAYRKQGCFSVNPRQFLAGATASPQKTWSLPSGVKAESGPLSGGGRLVLLGNGDVFKLKDGAATKLCTAPQAPYNLGFAISTTHVATGGNDSKITLCKLNLDGSGAPSITQLYETSRPSWISVARFSHNGRFLAEGNWSGDVYVTDIETKKTLVHFKKAGASTDIIFDPSDEFVCVLGTRVFVHHIETGRQIMVLDIPERYAAGGNPGRILKNATGVAYGNGGGRVFIMKYQSTRFNSAFDEAHAIVNDEQ